MKIHTFTQLSLLLIGFCPLIAALTNDTYRVGDKDYIKELCPPIESLQQQKNMTWTAPNGWKSTNPSFYRSLKQFTGAQWLGVNVGDIICLYTAGGKSDFPVSLKKPMIVLSPTGGNWTEDKGGYKDCKTDDITQCPFYVQSNEPKKTNLYEELEFYKDKM